MKLPLQIVFRHMDRSLWLERIIQRKAAKLDRFYQHIMSCRVVIEQPHKHHHRGNAYCMHIDIGVPNDQIMISRSADKNIAAREIMTVINDAFDAAKRQLEDYVRCRRNQIKVHSQKKIQKKAVLAEQ